MDQLRRTPLGLGVAIAVFCGGLLVLLLLPLPGGPTVPAVACLLLGACAALLRYYAPADWYWREWLYVPALGFGAFGVVFLFNALTGDWAAWGYAWAFCLGAVAVGAAMAAREGGSPPLVGHVSVWLAIAGFTGFIIFGAVVSGPFMRSFAIVLLAGLAAGAGLFVWGRTHQPRPVRAVAAPGDDPFVDPAVNAGLIEPLSPREIEVLQLIESGLSNSEIADKLVVAQSTVKTHINSIYGKLGAKSRTDALHRAKELGLL